MDQKQKELDHEMTQHKLEEMAARLRGVRAQAEEDDAVVAVAELSGLTALERRIRNQFDEWKRADEESWERLKSAVQRGIDVMSTHLDTADERLARLDDATLRVIDAEIGQIEATNDVIQARAGQEWVIEKKMAVEDAEDLKKALEEVKQKRQELRTKGKEHAAKIRVALERKITELKQRMVKVGEKLQAYEEDAFTQP